MKLIMVKILGNFCVYIVSNLWKCRLILYVHCCGGFLFYESPSSVSFHVLLIYLAIKKYLIIHNTSGFQLKFHL